MHSHGLVLVVLSCADGDDATRAFLREHILPHFERAGWAISSPLKAMWNLAVSQKALVTEEHATVITSNCDMNSSSLILEVIRRTAASSQGSTSNDSEDDELCLSIIPNSLAEEVAGGHTEVEAGMIADENSAADRGPSNSAVACSGDRSSSHGDEYVGRDSADNAYRSINDVWPAESNGSVNHGAWYSTSKSYWKNVDANITGMLGGLPSIHPSDVAASLSMIDKLRQAHECPLADGIALDCGAGIGRISQSVLLQRFQQVELVEPSPIFLEKARQNLQPDRVSATYQSTLQGFVPPIGRIYAAVWVQWVLNYLIDDDVVRFLQRCVLALAPHGWFVVKESVARDASGFYVDRADASITRTDAHFRELFKAAGLKVERTEMQPNLPRAVFPVRMYALRPIHASA